MNGMLDSDITDAAARALGWIDYQTDSVECGDYWHKDAQKAPFGPRVEKSSWQPLENDAQAYALALALSISIEFNDALQYVRAGRCVAVGYKDDKYAATRRAIVRAAAEIGRSMA